MRRKILTLAALIALSFPAAPALADHTCRPSYGPYNVYPSWHGYYRSYPSTYRSHHYYHRHHHHGHYRPYGYWYDPGVSIHGRHFSMHFGF